MGVTYKLKDEVVQYIIEQRQVDPFASCRELAEAASAKFGLRLSKSSVHDVLKESGVVTPRGRKPKNKFEIPQEKKKQIQSSLSKIKLLPSPVDCLAVTRESTNVIPAKAGIQNRNSDMDPRFRGDDNNEKPQAPIELPPPATTLPPDEGKKITTEYEGAGKIFMKAALWDLGIFSQENIKEIDWAYYLTYTKGVKLELENGQHVFIDLPLPIERCIRETADALVNNIIPIIIHQVSDETLFKACMDNQIGFKLRKVSIVDQIDHVILELSQLMEYERKYIQNIRTFVVCDEFNAGERARKMFFPRNINPNLMEDLSHLMGFDGTDNGEIAVTLLIKDTYEFRTDIEQAAGLINSMYIKDADGRKVTIKIQATELKL